MVGAGSVLARPSVSNCSSLRSSMFASEVITLVTDSPAEPTANTNPNATVKPTITMSRPPTHIALSFDDAVFDGVDSYSGPGYPGQRVVYLLPLAVQLEDR